MYDLSLERDLLTTLRENDLSLPASDSRQELLGWGGGLCSNSISLEFGLTGAHTSFVHTLATAVSS